MVEKYFSDRHGFGQDPNEWNVLTLQVGVFGNVDYTRGTSIQLTASTIKDGKTCYAVCSNNGQYYEASSDDSEISAVLGLIVKVEKGSHVLLSKMQRINAFPDPGPGSYRFRNDT